MPSVLIRDVRVFDGRSDRLTVPTGVLIRGDKIEALGASSDLSADRVIEGRGLTLMPGLIDAHWHAAFAGVSKEQAMMADFGMVAIAAGREAEATLMRGFTSVRDLGGPVLGIKQAIDAGLVPGPRIYPSGAMISQTGGHGDFRLPYEIPRANDAPLTYAERIRATAIADGVPEVLRRTREQLMLGASQIKLMAGGGVSSQYDPIDVSQYTEEEFRAAVEAAANWGTYVTVHAYTPRAIREALRAGVRCIDHGQLADEATVKMIADHGAWWCLQSFLDDELANPHTGAARQKQLEVARGTDRAFELAIKYGVKTAWGTDILFSPGATHRQSLLIGKLTRWYTPAQACRLITSNNGELLGLSGPRNPYGAEVGVIAPGALADLLLVEGNPLENLSVLTDPEANFKLIMKGGKVYKNSL